MTTWQQDQAGIPQPISNELVAKTLELISEPTEWASEDVALALAPWDDLDPEYKTLTLTDSEARMLREGLDVYELLAGKALYQDRFWKHGKPWRLILRRQEAPVLPKRVEEACRGARAFEVPTIGETSVVVRNYNAGRETFICGGAVQVTDLPAMTVITVWKEQR